MNSTSGYSRREPRQWPSSGQKRRKTRTRYALVNEFTCFLCTSFQTWIHVFSNIPSDFFFSFEQTVGGEREREKEIFRLFVIVAIITWSIKDDGARDNDGRVFDPVDGTTKR